MKKLFVTLLSILTLPFAAQAQTVVAPYLSPAASNPWSVTQTISGATGTSPNWCTQITTDTVARLCAGLNSNDIAKIGFGAGGSSARDTFIERSGAASIRFGDADAASPIAQTISVQNVVAGTNNTAGVNTTIMGSASTGNAVGGNIIFQVSPAGSSGTTQNSFSTALTILGNTNINVATRLQANATNGPAFNGVSATSTVPTLIPDRADLTTGVGRQATGNISLITGATEIQRILTTGTELIVAGSDATHTDATVCRDTTSGLLYAGSGTGGICLGTSSIRFKQTFTPFSDALSSIMKMRPGYYFYKSGYGLSDREQFGFLAEDMINIQPKLVGLDNSGQPNSVDLLGLVPLLVKAVQEQQQEIIALENQLRQRN